MKAVNKQSFKQKLMAYKRKPLSLAMYLLVVIATILTVGALLFLIGYILIMGIPNIKPEMFSWEYNSENVSFMPAIVNTVIMTALSLLIAAPLGIFSAIYLVEYAKRGNKFVGVIRTDRKSVV